MRRLLIGACVGLSLAGCSSGSVEWPSPEAHSKPPYAEGVQVGQTYHYVLPSHCGIVQAKIDGSFWEAQPPLVVGEGSPPSGWQNPLDKGRLRIESKDKAIFMAGDKRVVFKRADAPPRQCN